MKFLYARASTNEWTQHIDRQTISAEQYDEVFIDYTSSGSTNCPKLQEMLKWERKGDISEVHSIDRLARNINNLLQIVKTITEFEINKIKMRQVEGIAIAKQKGVYSKERCKKLSLSQIEEFKKDVENKVRVCEILKKYKITKPTYYRYRENYGV